MQKLKLTVIICTYNRERYIYNVLQSIAQNNFDKEDYEILVVNNNSSDNTAVECQRFHHDYPDVVFRCIDESRQGLSYARNAGVTNARGDVVVFVDDDATVNDKYLDTYNTFFVKRQDVMAAGGPIIPRYETEEPSWMSYYTRALITGCIYYGKEERRFPRGKYPGGGNAAYRKEVFDTIGMFNPDLGRKGNSLIGAEEKDLFSRMDACGIKYYYLPTAVLYHIIPEGKLTDSHFNRLTLSIGKSERIRTLSVSKSAYVKRLLSEGVKWCASIVLWVAFLLRLQPHKGNKIVQFRWNVSRGLLNIGEIS